MTVEHPVRRWLARVCSPETMARVVDPTLADMRVEAGRPAWLGYLALVRALAMHGVTSFPEACSRLYHDDERAVPRAIGVGAFVTLLLTALLIAPAARNALRISWHIVVLLLPQALAIALPTSLLLAIPLAFRKASDRRRVMRRGVVLSAICAAATLIVMIEIIPDANQAFRVEVARQFDPGVVHVPRGAIEMSLRELRERIDILRLTPGGVVEARRFEYTIQMKLAMSGIPLPLGLLAIAITIAARGRARSIALGVGSTFVYVYGVFAADAWTVQWLRRSDAVPPAVLAWAPAVLIAALALTILWRSRIRAVRPCA
jgi:hypothetical protein